MKAKIRTIILIVEKIALFFMASVGLYSVFINPIEYELTLACSAAIIILLSINIRDYLDKGSFSLVSILLFSVSVIAFIVSLI